MSTEVKSFYEEGGKGIRSWIFTMDHKRVAFLYLYGVLFWFLLAVFIGLLLRVELMWPTEQFMGAQAYNAAFTLHGVIMIFLFIIPGIPAIFGNFVMPLQIGAPDVIFPKVNLISWYLYMTGGLLAVISLFANGPADTGWTFYVPFSTTTHTNVSITVMAAFMLGFSSIATGLNFVATIHRLRHPKIGWGQIPLFSWSIYAAGWVQILATPILGITLLLIVFERVFNIGIFDPARGGDPVLYQHLFWMYSHPAVYIMILPGMGIISEIIPTFSRKAVFGYKAIAFSSLAIAVAGSLVWAHHMYTAGMSDISIFVFSFLTFLVAIPSAVKVFNWIATLYKGSLVMSPPFLLALMFIYLFTVGGLMGLVLGAVSTDIHTHDTHFIVSHFHFVMFGGTGYAFFAALHYWFPKMYGRIYNFKHAYISIIMMNVGFVLHYVPMMIVGLEGMPRRYYTYVEKFAVGNYWSGIGGILMVVGMYYMFFNLFWAIKKGKPMKERNPWGAATMEWQVPSPPPVANYDRELVISEYPYDFSKVKKE